MEKLNIKLEELRKLASDFKRQIDLLLNDKVSKVDGKQLSTEDYTTAEKNKLKNLEKYTHPTTDGNKHVPENGTTNAGKVLTAGNTAGSYTWESLPSIEAITAQEIETMWGDIIG